MFPNSRPTEATGCLLGIWEVIGKESCGLERICGCLYVHFETILGFTRNEQMRCSKAFQGNENCAKYPRSVTSHVDTPRNVSGGNMARSGRVIFFQKQQKLKVIIHAFRFYQDRSLNATRCLLWEWKIIASLERSQVAWNKYVDAFTFISRQF